MKVPFKEKKVSSLLLGEHFRLYPRSSSVVYVRGAKDPDCNLIDCSRLDEPDYQIHVTPDYDVYVQN